MDKFEEEYAKQGGDRVQLHNIYKVPLIIESKRIQSEVRNEIASISSQYDNLINSKQNQINEIQRKLLSISDDKEGITSQIHEMDSKSAEKELANLLDRKRAAMQNVSKRLENELNNLLDKLEEGALTTLERG